MYCIGFIFIPILLGLQVRKLLVSLVHSVCVRACLLPVVTVMRVHCILKVLHEGSFH